VSNGQELLTLRGHEGPVLSAAFNPDATRIITAGDDRTARLWDAATGQELLVLRGHEAGVRCAAFSPDGTQVVTGSKDGIARLWPLPSDINGLIEKARRIAAVRIRPQ
jgi:WD40 repeat protein